MSQPTTPADPVRPCTCLVDGACPRYKRFMTTALRQRCISSEPFRRQMAQLAGLLVGIPRTLEPLAQDIASLAKRLWNARQKWTAAGKPVRTPEQMEATVQEFCQPCTWFRPSRADPLKGKCGYCGCALASKATLGPNKLRYATEGCPLPEPRFPPLVVLTFPERLSGTYIGEMELVE